MTGYGYRGYGLNLVSELELPEFLPAPVAIDADISIRLDPASIDTWRDSAGPDGEFVSIRQGGHLLRVSGVAFYHVSGGREICIAAEPGADPGLVRLFTIGSAMGMALHQRGVMVLHGATVARGGVARIFVGDSGAGKSTLAARLGRAGCAVLGDDTMALWNAPTRKSGKWLWQGSRVFKLWEDSIAAMGMGTDGLDRLGNRTDKYYVPNPDSEANLAVGADAGVELAEILVLEEAEGPPRIEPIDGLRALQAVAVNTYRREYVSLLGREPEHFRQCGELVRDVTVSRLIRPWGLPSIPATLELILSRWDLAPAAQGSR
ncbi:MAG TPA: hypothetical protein VMY41_15780 [Thermohalobaculum sp.]|nr:hypothetical protein [Thermohalobaculum sp.]